MSQAIRLLSPMESVQVAWGLKLRDFRQWCSPSNQVALTNWKTRRLEGAIIVARSTMIDDAEAMLKAIAQTDNARAAMDLTNSGTSVSLPIMITAISAIETPPEREQVIGVANWLNVVIPKDPLQRIVQMRTMPIAYKCQVAFFAPDPHSASAIAKQFVTFWRDEAKRSLNVSYDVGYATTLAGTTKVGLDWKFRVIENSLYPDKADVGIPNVYAVTIDCMIVGAEPNVVGLGGYGDDITDKGEPDGSIPDGLPPIGGGGGNEDELNAVVTEADLYELQSRQWTRVNADPLTGIITQTNMGLFINEP